MFSILVQVVGHPPKKNMVSHAEADTSFEVSSGLIPAMSLNIQLVRS